jgi:hypothetical protein
VTPTVTALMPTGPQPSRRGQPTLAAHNLANGSWMIRSRIGLLPYLRNARDCAHSAPRTAAETQGFSPWAQRSALQAS